MKNMLVVFSEIRSFLSSCPRGHLRPGQGSPVFVAQEYFPHTPMLTQLHGSCYNIDGSAYMSKSVPKLVGNYHAAFQGCSVKQLLVGGEWQISRVSHYNRPPVTTRETRAIKVDGLNGTMHR